MHQGQESGWQSGMRSCIMPGLTTYLMQELNVGTVDGGYTSKAPQTSILICKATVTACVPALTAVLSQALALTAIRLSPLPSFESRPEHVRKLPVTFC